MRRFSGYSGVFRSVFGCRLCWRITLTVFLAIFLVEAAILVPSYRNYERNLLGRLDEVGRSAMVSVVNLHPPSAEHELLVAARKLSWVSKVTGGAFYRPDGKLILRFGEAPQSPLERIARDGPFRASMDRFEVLWALPGDGLPVSVVARLDASHIPAQLTAFVGRIGGLVLLISLFVCGVTMLILGRAVLGPLLGIRTNLLAAQRDPENADRYTLPEKASDEVGEMITALNLLLKRVSKTHREDLATMVAMADSTSQGVIAFDSGRDVVYANRACLEFCGAGAPAELATGGLPRFELENEDRVVTLRDMLADGEFSGEATLVGRLGNRIPCYINLSQVSDASGQVLRYFALITDITEVRDAHKVLQQKNLELESSNRAKSQFVANMSHELRTPLNAIIGFSEIMGAGLLGPLGNAQYEGYAKDIHTSGNHLLELINDLLDLAKIEAGKLELHEEPIDPAGAIESSLRLIKPRAETHKITLWTEISDDLPLLRADRRKLKQILINLLSNAVKFTPDGGDVGVSAATDGDGWLKIAVCDTGIGIAAEEFGKVFDPFGQADGGLDRPYEGTGLGLTLTKAMVELHDGTLDLQSRLEEGTTVTINFPPWRLVA